MSWEDFLPDAGLKTEAQLCVEADAPDSLGGTAQSRAEAKVELRRRDRAAADLVASKQLAIAEQQAKAAKWAVIAAWGSAVVTFLVGVLPFFKWPFH